MKAYCSILFTVLLLIWFAPLCAQDSFFTNSINMAFRYIPAGSFTMARFAPPYPTPPSDSTQTHPYKKADYKLAQELAEQDAQPGFNAVIPKAFYMGRFELTQAQWQAVMGNNPSVFQGTAITDTAALHPVENVSWNEVQQFLKKLNALEKGRTYRLPTEAEWEYAARAGATGDIGWGAIREAAQLGLRTTAHIGGKTPNAWGLYDMLGNVWEWTQDLYNEKLFAGATPPAKGTQHVLKGASFVGDVKNATYITHAAGPGNGWDVGFRVLLEIN